VAPFAVQTGHPPGRPAVRSSRRSCVSPARMTNIDELNRAVRGWGLISVDPTEGAIRRIRWPRASMAPSFRFAVELLRVAVGAPALRLIVSGSRVHGVQVGDSFIPPKADGAVRVHFSAAQRGALRVGDRRAGRRADPDRLERKLVLIGVTGSGRGIPSHTLGRADARSEIHAQLVENIYDGTLLLRRIGAAAGDRRARAARGPVGVGNADLEAVCRGPAGGGPV